MFLILAFLLAIVGEIADARSTQVALRHNAHEQNGLMARVLKRFGVAGLYVLKIAIPVVFFLLSLIFLSDTSDVAALAQGLFGLAGFGAAFYNYRQLWALGVKHL